MCLIYKEIMDWRNIPMKNIKNSKRILIATMAIMIALSTSVVSVMSGCVKSKDSATETIAITETQIVTEIVNETYVVDENNQTDAKDSEDNSENKADGKDSSSQNSNTSGETSNSNSKVNSTANAESNVTSSKNQTSKDSSSNNSTSKNDSNNNNNSSNSSNSNSSSSNKKVLTLDGNKYSVGSTVTCVYKLKSPEALENFQATIKYDSKYLKVKSAKLSEIARGGSVINFKLDGEIKFNGSNISTGYEFEKGGEFLTVTYEVLATGNTSTDFEWEVATGMSGKAYVTENEPASGLKISKAYS